MSFYGTNDGVYGSGQYGVASFGIVTPVVALTGVSSTGAVSTPSSNISVSLSGVSATGQITVVEPGTGESLLSVSATGFIGALSTTLTANPTLASVSATGQLGTISRLLNSLKLITSVVGTGGVGTVSVPLTANKSVVGVSGTGAVSAVSYDIAPNVVGVSATASVGDPFASAIYGANDAIYGIGRYGTARYGIVTPFIQPRGFELTASVEPVSIDGFEIQVVEKVTGVSATVSIGNVKTIPVLVSGVQATGAVNTVIGFVITFVDIAGVAGTGVIGTIEPQITEDLGENPVTSVSATGSVGSVQVDVVEKLASVSVVGTINLPAPSDAITVFVANAYDRKNTVRVIPSGFSLTSVDSGRAASEYSRLRMVTVPPKQTSNHRRAA